MDKRKVVAAKKEGGGKAEERKEVLSILGTLRDRPDPGGGEGVAGAWEDETSLLEKFVIKYKNAYDFSGEAAEASSSRRPGTQDNVFLQLFQAILEFRFLEGRWQQLVSSNHRLVVLQCMRLLMRDRFFQRRFLLMGGRDVLVSVFDEEGIRHYTEVSRHGAAAGQYPLVHIASMLTKLDADVLVHCCKTLCYLLSTSDPYLLQCILISLHTLSQSGALLSQHCQGILQFPAGDGAVETCEKLLEILQFQPKLEFRQLTAEILISVSAIDSNRATVMANEGLKIFLGMLQNTEHVLLVDALRLLEIQVMDPEASRQVRTLGGINMILNLLGSRSTPDGPEGQQQRRYSDAEERHQHAVLVSACSLLTQLSFDDDNSLHIRQLNGVYVLGNLLLHECHECAAQDEEHAVQAQALRALRFLFSLERNRKSFKRIFPPAIFERFIEVGQYERDVGKYVPLAAAIGALPADKRDLIRKAVNEMVDYDVDKRVGRYLLLGDPIGKGGFGTIYRTRREGGQTYFALKEIPLEHGQSDDVETHREVSLLQQVEHPNIVKYVESFSERSPLSGRLSLFIIMELVEGSSLMELINSHSEKKQLIPEKRVRELLIQICHGLYYIHKKKQITHRDLTPNNILLNSEIDAITAETVLRPILVDFGLARQRKNDNSVMSSVVGTLTYSCPELIERRPYTDKADIWSLGVIIYHLVCLKNPFTDTNPLQTARRIVEGDFTPIDDPEKAYSDCLKGLIAKMMNPSTEKRPDVVQLMTETACWDRSDRMTERDCIERTDELYLRSQMLESRLRRLEVEKEREKERLESVIRGQRETITRGGGFRMPTTAGGTLHRRSSQVPNTPGKLPHTPGSAYGRHLPQTPGGRTGRQSRAPSIRVPAMSVKEIDPATQMLNQLHRIVFVTQLPPQLEESPDHAKMRRAIEKYKRALFSRGASGEGLSLKQEMQKMLTYSEEEIDVDFSGPDTGRADTASSPDKPAARWVLTYENMCRMLEVLLLENGYYDTSDEVAASEQNL